MTPRRRITSIVDQQHGFRELGIVRFSDPKPADGKRPGRPNPQPRVTSRNRAVVEQVAEVYGDGTVEAWQPEPGRDEYVTRVTDPAGLAIAVPPGIEPFTLAYERWQRGFLSVRCDGQAMQYRSRGRWIERECECAKRGYDYGSEDHCDRTLRITFAIIGIRELGVFRVNSKSYNASRDLPLALAVLQRSGRAGRLTMEQQSDKVLLWDEKAGQDKPTGRRFMVITVSAPFLIDELVQIERGEGMQQLPAPSAPALPRGARPQLGPGADLPPTGPSYDDVPPPPIPPAPPALPDDETPVFEGEVAEHPDEPEGAHAAAEGEQRPNPEDPPAPRTPGQQVLDNLRAREGGTDG